MQKILIVLVMIVVLGLLYVRGQVELVHLSYEINNREQQLEKTVFINRALEYKLTALKSPAMLEQCFAGADPVQPRLAAWQIGGTINTPAVEHQIRQTKVVSAQPGNVWEKIFNPTIAEASADNITQAK